MVSAIWLILVVSVFLGLVVGQKMGAASVVLIVGLMILWKISGAENRRRDIRRKDAQQTGRRAAVERADRTTPTHRVSPQSAIGLVAGEHSPRTRDPMPRVDRLVADARGEPPPQKPARAVTGPVSGLTAGQMVWMPLGKLAVIGGRTISNGGFYVASNGIPSCTGAVIESQPVATKEEPDWQADNIGYWPHYTRLSPAQRLAYLGYLNSPRRSTQIGQTFLWLYLYNIEFRLLIEPITDVSDDEFAALYAEVEALFRTYQMWSSVRRYLPGLLGAAAARRGATVLPKLPEPPALSWTEDLALRAGQALALGGEVSPQWALQIALLNRPVSRSHLEAIGAELLALFSMRYAALPEKRRAPKLGRRRLTVDYQRAMDGQRMSLVCNVPDVRRQTSPFAAWVVQLDECLLDLDALRKARISKTATALSRLGSLPEALAASGHLPEVLQKARQYLLAMCGAGPAVVDWATVVSALGASDAEPKKRELVHAAQALGLVRLGIEPDPRFGTGSKPVGGKLVVFKIDGDVAGAPSGEFTAGLLLAQCGYQIAASDGFADAEAEATLGLVARDLGLRTEEMQRLRAHLVLIAIDGAQQNRVMSKLKAMPGTKRHGIARAMVGIAGADGEVDAAEIKMLGKLYQAVGLNHGALHVDIHEVLAGGGPASVATAPGRATEGEVTINRDVVARKMAETSRVQTLLAEVFVDDEPEIEIIAGDESDHDVRLDLLQTLAASAPALPRVTWEAFCEGKGLLPDAALDSVNEWAVDQCGEPLTEGDDPIEINTWAAGELGLPVPAEEQR